MSERYYLQDGSPDSYSKLQLRSKQVQHDTLVQPESAKDDDVWVRAGDVEDLKDILPAIEPALPKPTPEKTKATDPASSAPQPLLVAVMDILRAWRLYIIVGLGTFVLAWVLLGISECQSKQRTTQEGEEYQQYFQDSLRLDREQKERERLAREAEERRLDSLSRTPENRMERFQDTLQSHRAEIARLEAEVMALTSRHTKIVDPRHGSLKKAEKALKKANNSERASALADVTRLKAEYTRLDDERKKARARIAFLHQECARLEREIRELTQQIENSKRDTVPPNPS